MVGCIALLKWKLVVRCMSAILAPHRYPPNLLKLLVLSEYSKNILPYVDFQWIEIAFWGELSDVNPKGKSFFLNLQA